MVSVFYEKKSFFQVFLGLAEQGTSQWACQKVRKDMVSGFSDSGQKCAVERCSRINDTPSRGRGRGRGGRGRGRGRGGQGGQTPYRETVPEFCPSCKDKARFLDGHGKPAIIGFRAILLKAQLHAIRGLDVPTSYIVHDGSWRYLPVSDNVQLQVTSIFKPKENLFEKGNINF